jgi:hypothetical protein
MCTQKYIHTYIHTYIRNIAVQELSAEEVARKAMKIASDVCIYTNHNHIVEILDCATATKDAATATKDEKEGQKS